MSTTTPVTDPNVGRLVGARYRLQQLIGRGGMATVYRALDEQLDRPVALKLMREHLLEDPHFVRRFEAEARHMAALSHPNVVGVYDVGTDGAPYMVMELVEGRDLAAKLAAEGRLDPAEAARIGADAAAALHAAHARGLVHRDVKPGNVLIGADGRARVADFGIARATAEDGMTGTGALLGSVEYFSPEQARGAAAGPASDVYALGVVLYEMLTGARPFTGTTPYAVATARLGVRAPDPRDVVGGIPDRLAAIVQGAMAPQPTDRYPTAEALRRELLRWLDEHNGAGGPVMPARATGGSRWPVAAAALFVLVLIGFGGARLLAPDVADERSDERGVVIPSVSPGGVAVAQETPTPSLVPTPSPTPMLTVTPSPTPLAPAPVPPAATPPAQAPTAAPVAAADPKDSVGAFYANAEAGNFDAAYGLWSARMKATYPRQANLDDRFDQTADIAFSALYVARQTASSATVQANFTETYDNGSTRSFVGYWDLVRVDGRWLLDAPTY